MENQRSILTKKSVSFGKCLSIFIKMVTPIKPIEDKNFINIISEKLKKYSLIGYKIGVPKSKGGINGLSQIVVIGDIQNDNDIVILVSENLLHRVSDVELESQLAIALAESKFTYQSRYNFIAVIPGLLLFLNLAVQIMTRPYISPDKVVVVTLFYSAISFISLIMSPYIIGRLKKMGTYLIAVNSFNVKIEDIVLLRDSFLKKYIKQPFFVSLMMWLMFLSPKQIHKLKKLLESGTVFGPSFMLKTYFTHPIVLINIFTMLTVVFIAVL